MSNQRRESVPAEAPGNVRRWLSGTLTFVFTNSSPVGPIDQSSTLPAGSEAESNNAQSVRLKAFCESNLLQLFRRRKSNRPISRWIIVLFLKHHFANHALNVTPLA